MSTESHITLSPFFSYLIASNNLEELHKRILELVESLGFSDYSFLRYGGPNLEVVLWTAPIEQSKAYLRENLREHDFALRYGVENISPIFLSKVYGAAYEAGYEIDRFTCNKRINELNRLYGYYEQYCIPMRSRYNDQKVIFILSKRGASSTYLKAKVNRVKSSLDELCETIDYVITLKFKKLVLYIDPTQSIKLKRKSVLVLETLWNSSSRLKVIAKQLCMSQSSVDQHLAAARKALNRATTHGAMLKAHKLGIISYSDTQLE